MVQLVCPEHQSPFRPLNLHDIKKTVIGLHKEIGYVPGIDRTFIQNANELRSENPAVLLEPLLPGLLGKIVCQHALEPRDSLHAAFVM